jgi:hypothetical protein
MNVKVCKKFMPATSITVLLDVGDQLSAISYQLSVISIE